MFACCVTVDDAEVEIVQAMSSIQHKSAPQEALEPQEVAQVAQALDVLDAQVHNLKEIPETGSLTTTNVILKRSSATTPWGLQFEQVAVSDILIITGLSAGAARDYNKATDDFDFRPYDCIVGVNGKQSLLKMLDAMNGKATQLELMMKRPETLRETLKKEDGQSHGMVLRHTETGTTVTVKNIKDAGLVKKSDANIIEGDMIIAIDGKMGKGSELVNILSNSRGSSNLLLLRVNNLLKTNSTMANKVILKRTSATDLWGLRYEPVAESDTLLITGLSNGAAEEYNKASDDFELRPYDCIVRVDGDNNLVKMLRALSSPATQVELMVKRPATLKETLKKEDGQSYGMVLRHTESGTALLVKGIKDTGSVKKTDANVLKGDMIIAIDGEMGKGSELLYSLSKSRGTSELLLLRVNNLPKTGSPIEKKVILTRTSATAPWGLHYEAVAESDTLLITGLSDGAMQDYNEASKDFEFRPYDCIVGVNGETSLVTMLEAMYGAATQMELMVKRPATLKETLKKEDLQSCGMVLRHTERGTTLLVKEIKDTGSVKKCDANIREGDIIAAVDGQMGTGSELLSLLTESRGASSLFLLRINNLPQVKVQKVKELRKTDSPITKHVILKRTSATASWGLKCEQVAESNTLTITGLTDGAAQDYNKASADFEFRPHDCIVGVDGETSLAKMVEVMNGAATQIEMMITVKDDGQSHGRVLARSEPGVTVADD